MPRFPISSSYIKEKIVMIGGSDHRHITKVLRLNKGDQITLFDENSYEHTAKIIDIGSSKLSLEILNSERVNRESQLNLNLFQAVIKNSKFELVIQKATELGVKTITPIITDRTQNKKNYNLNRWIKIARESSKQCNRTEYPKLRECTKFTESINSTQENQLSILLYENSTNSIKTVLQNSPSELKTINLYIGPEGGWTDNEIEDAKKSKLLILGLGQRILRAETAAISAITLMQFYFGDL